MAETFNNRDCNRNLNFLIEGLYMHRQKSRITKNSYQTAPEHLQFFWRSLYHKIKRIPIKWAQVFQLQIDST